MSYSPKFAPFITSFFLDFDDVRTSEVPTPSGSSSPKASFQNVATLDDDDDDNDTPANRILRGLPGSSSDEGSGNYKKNVLENLFKSKQSQANPINKKYFYKTNLQTFPKHEKLGSD